MRFGFLLATAASLTIHALMLWLMPTLSPARVMPFKLPSDRLQARLLPAQPKPPRSATPLEAAKASPSPQPDTAAWRSQKSPVFTATTSTTTTIAPSGSSQVSEPAANATPSLGTAPAQTAPPDVATRNMPLDLTVRADKTPRRTALQEAVEQQAIRPDAMARVFERVVEQTPPVNTEITQTVDSQGRVTVKVRTPWSTYCVSNSTPPGATLYDLKALAGNCPK